ncbi:MAG: TDP-N-acetylfucosamine:lipid II N-acetylfucosaminyltransferase [Balneolaceae bacterium]|nr:TDP-N-acetylfucosamine:lipid II N-acetylfucosaminyltransferase [Balneolaceae bacterium]
MSNPPQIDEALRILNGLKQVNHPSSWVIQYLTGIAYVRKQDFEAAIAPLELALRKGGKSLEVLQLLMEACMKSNRFDRAKTLIPDVLKIKEDDVPAWKNLAIIYCKELRYEDALVAIGKANNFAPTDLSLVIMAGKVYGYLNKFGEALNTFESLIQAKPDFLEAHLGKAWIFIKAQKPQDALRLLTHLTQSLPQNDDIKALLAECYFEMNNFDEAIPVLEELIPKNNTDSSLLELYSQCLQRVGKMEEAEFWANKVMENTIPSREFIYKYAAILEELCDCEIEPSQLKNIQKLWDKAQNLETIIKPKPNAKKESKRLKIGIISNALWDNEVGRRWNKMLSAFPKEIGKFVAFSTDGNNDAISQSIAAQCSVFNWSHQISPVELAEQISALNLDALIDASSGFSPIIDYVFQNSPSLICISSNDRSLYPFETAAYDFILAHSEKADLVSSRNSKPANIACNNIDDLAPALFAAYSQAVNSSNKEWKRGRWQKEITESDISVAKKEIQEKISAHTASVTQSVEDDKIFSDQFWNGFTDARKAAKIVEITNKFSAINQSDAYLKQIVDETVDRLEKDPTDNVAFFIQTMALLARKPAVVTELDAELNQALTLKGWESKSALFSYWFDKVEYLQSSVGSKVSAIIISNKFKEKSVENLRQLSKQLKGIGEIIFVNNGIEDNQFSALFPFVHTYVKAKGNAGAYLARNLGAAFAKGERLLFVDDDGIPQPNFIQAHLNAHSEREAVVSRGMYYSSNVMNDPWHYNIGNTQKPAYTILEGNAMYRAEAFYKTGGWGDYILFGHGGKDLSFRLLEHYPHREHQIYVPESRLYHEYLRGNAHQKEKKKKQEVSLRLLEALHPGLKKCIDTWPTQFSSKSSESTQKQTSLLPIKAGKKAKFMHICRQHVYTQSLSDMIEYLNEHSDQQHYLLVEKTPWNVAGGYTIEEEKNPSTFTFDYTSQSDVNGIVNELTLPEVNAVFMHGLFRAWEFSLIDIISEKTPVGWIIWGGDLYKPLKNNQKNKIPAQKLAYILTPVKGDSDTFQAEFGDKPWFDFAYPYPGLYGDIELSAPQNKTKKLLVGNSGDPSNNHIDVLNMLAAKKDIEEYQVIMPLAYNFKAAYKQQLLQHIEELGLANQIIMHEEFILPDEYLKLINEVDAIVMAHDRQQAIGNTLMALYAGKQVYLKDRICLNNELTDNPTWDFLTENGFTIQSLDEFEGINDLSEIQLSDEENWKKHQQIIRKKFGLEARAELLRNSCNAILELEIKQELELA